jgi:hypothetical protein
MPIDWSYYVIRGYSAVSIQKVWRAHNLRVKMIPVLISQTLRRRSAIAIQRWYRWQATVGKRLNLLNMINTSVLSIREAAFFLDAKIYHLLLKYPSFSILNHSSRRFPEFRGIPVFENKFETLQFSTLNKYFSHKSEISSVENSLKVLPAW